MEESTGSCGPLKHDDIKVPIKYFFVTMRTTQKTPRSQKAPNQPKPWLLVYSAAFLARTATTRCCVGRAGRTHLHHHATPKQLHLETASRRYLTEQVMVAAGTRDLLQCTPNINKQCLLANAFKSFLSFFVDWTHLTTGT